MTLFTHFGDDFVTGVPPFPDGDFCVFGGFGKSAFFRPGSFFVGWSMGLLREGTKAIMLLNRRHKNFD